MRLLMLALYLKVVGAAIVTFAVAFAFIASSLGFATSLAAGFVVLVASYGATLGIEFLVLRRSFAPSDPDRPRGRELIKAWLLETAATPPIFLWQQPFRSRAVADYVPATSRLATGRGVVLIHGFVCNRGLWNRWMRRLRDEGIPFIAVDLEPVFGSIDDYVPIIDKAVRTITESTGSTPVVVAHSMGGLAVRAWRATSADPIRCHAVVTIGSPHRGTWMARHSTTRNGREMRVGSTWLGRLEARERMLRPQRFVCFWSRCDNIVFPSATATLSGADNRHLESTPHVQMIHHPATMAEVLRLVAEPRTPD